MRRVVEPRGRAAMRGLRLMRSAMKWALLTLMAPAVLRAQDDSLLVGPPPHFIAAWAPPGTLIDVSRTGVLRQRITIDLADIPIEQAVAEIRDQAQVHLIYGKGALPSDRRVSIRARGITLASALADVLMDTGLDVVMMRNGQLTLVPCSHPVAAVVRDSGVVQGRVIERGTGAPIVGASVKVGKASSGATTDAQGRYRLVGLASGSHPITARYIGFKPTTVTVQVGADTVVRELVLEPAIQELEQVVVTGTIVPTEMKAVPTPVTVITADDIRRLNVQRIDQLFRGQTAGAFAQDPSGLDHVSALTVRGASSFGESFVKVFIDGVEVSDPFFISGIDPNSVDRIELVRGPQASTMYGSDAIGGVMQVFLKKGSFERPIPSGDAKVVTTLIQRQESGGLALRHEEGFNFGGGGEKTRFNFGAYHRYDGEWTPAYENRNWSATLAGENVLGPFTTSVSARHAHKILNRPWLTPLRDSGFVRFSQPPYEPIETNSQTLGASFLYSAQPQWSHRIVVGYDRHGFESIQTKARPGDSIVGGVTSSGEKFSVLYYSNLNFSLNSSMGLTITAGVNHSRANSSTNIFSNATLVGNTLDGSASLTRWQYTNSGLFAQTQFDIASALFFTAGVRAEWNANIGQEAGTPLSPRLGIAYNRLIGSVPAKFRASYGEGIRPPTPLLSSSVSRPPTEQMANPSLKAEKQYGIDGGLDVYWGTKASVSVTYFSQRATDLIAQVFEPASPPGLIQYHYENVGVIVNKGLEVEAKAMSSRFDLTTAISVVNSKVQKLDPRYQGDYQVGDRPLRVPRLTAGIGAEYEIFRGTRMIGRVTHAEDWIGRDLIALYSVLYGGAPPRPTQRDFWIEYPGFTKIDLAAEKYLGDKVNLLFQVGNLTDNRSYESENLFFAPLRRSFSLTVRVTY